jgi:transposase
MPRSGPRKIYQYSDEFKLAAVRLSQQPGIQVQTVAAALEIHPFMLSKWRKDVKDGRLRGRPPKAPPPGPAREIAQLQALERKYAELKEEHDLLKKAIRFWSARNAKSSPSSTTSSRSVERSTKASTSLRSVTATTSRGRGSTRGAAATSVRARFRTGD